MRPWAVLLMLGALLVQPMARADDLTYVSDDELILELQRQQEDMARAKARMASLSQVETATASALQSALREATLTQRILEDRIRLVHRLSSDGRIGHYLTGATSGIELFKRLHTLKHLVLDGLKEYGRAREEVARLRGELAEIQEHKQQTDQMITVFEQACAELIAEQQRRL